MTMAGTVRDYLDRHHIPYELVFHPSAPTSMEVAEAAHVPGDRLAKGVLLEDGSHYILAVLPATHQIDLGQLHRHAHHMLGLATEAEAEQVFTDCLPGAIPALGPAYGLDTVVEESLKGGGDLYFEAGDRKHLVHVPADAAAHLWDEAKTDRFSHHV